MSRVTRALAAGLLLATSGFSEAGPRFSGYVKSFLITSESVDLPGSTRTWQSQNSLRVMWEGFGDRSAWQVHYELSPILSSRSQTLVDKVTFASPGAWRLTDLDAQLAQDGKQRLVQNLDRFNVQFNLDAGDLTIGRQPITFGAARVINPTDVFLPFDVRTFNQEYRIGVDAVRFQHPFGQLSEFDIGVIAGDDVRASTSAAFVQIRTHVDGKDLQFAAARFAKQSLIGGGVQSALGDFGFWLEAAGVSGDDDYIRLSTGLDYAFTESVFAMAEYHYNGAGSDDPSGYFGQLASTPYRVGGVFLLGEHYLIPVINWQVTPLWSASLQSVVNLSDHSTFVNLSAVYNVTQNAYMDLGYYHFSGDSFRPSPGGIRPGSEYGGNPDTLYASLRFYF